MKQPRRITITLAEGEWQRLEDLGRRAELRCMWLGRWRSTLLRRAFIAFLSAAEQQRICFPVRLELTPKQGDLCFDPGLVKKPKPAFDIWTLFRRS